MITFRRVTTEDFPLLAEWLAQPHVARWWNQESSSEAVERHFGPTVRGEEPAEDLLAFENGAPFAHAQRSRWIDYPEDVIPTRAFVEVPDDAISIDYLIGEKSQISKGRGTSLIRALVDDTWQKYPSSNTIMVPVVAGNIASWRALEKAGFRRVGEAQLEPDNPIDPPLHYINRIDRPA